MSKTDLQKTRIENKLPVAREGLPFIALGFVITLLLFYWDLYSLAIFLGLATIFTIYFFRDPDRTSPAEEDAVLSPADGTVIDIKHLDDINNLYSGPAIKISIFMSVFNVHVNRIPLSGKISGIKYNPGQFFSANLDKASEQNEKNCIALDTMNGQKIVFVQIAGLIARRIACWINEGDRVHAGQRFGLIRFGSRLDIYLPVGIRMTAKLKERVKAGESVIGYLP
jgi:phosphatidylserine decarboxylase